MKDEGLHKRDIQIQLTRSTTRCRCSFSLDMERRKRKGKGRAVTSRLTLFGYAHWRTCSRWHKNGYFALRHRQQHSPLNDLAWTLKQKAARQRKPPVLNGFPLVLKHSCKALSQLFSLDSVETVAQYYRITTSVKTLLWYKTIISRGFGPFGRTFHRSTTAAYSEISGTEIIYFRLK